VTVPGLQRATARRGNAGSAILASLRGVSMRSRPLVPLLLALALVLAAGCASAGGSSAAARNGPIVGVEVTNLSPWAADVYYGTQLLGMVPSGITERFALAPGTPRERVVFVPAGEPRHSAHRLPGVRARYLRADDRP
jgi:hypothetical protein